MSDVQRYAFDAFGPAHPGGVIIHADDGPYVTYEDHERAVAEAVAAERDRIDVAVLPILAVLARHACTADNWEQTDALIRRSVIEIKTAIRGASDE